MRPRALAALFTLLLPATLKQPTVHGAWVRALIPGQETTVAYMVLENPGNQPAILTGASCDCARAVELHQVVQAGGRMRMEPLPRLAIPAGGRVELKPGGAHLMIFGFREGLQPGQRVRLTLRFEAGGPVVAEVPVKAPEGARDDPR